MTDADRASRPGALWVVPTLLFFGVFAGLPLILVVYLSFTSWDGISPPVFVGLDNWARMLGDSGVYESIRITLLIMAAGWCVQTPLAMLIGVWSAGHQRNRAVLSSIFFLPLLLSSAAIAIAFAILLDPNFGLAADIGPWIGYEDGGILSDGTGALMAVIFVGAWQFVPFHALLYQAAARRIPQMLYDAATVDGAGRVRQFFSVTLPQLRHTIATSTVIILVGSIISFETVLILTGGGPGTATNVLPNRMYIEAFRSSVMGYASAIAVVLVVFATLLSLAIVRFSGFAKMRSTLEGL